MARWIGRGKGRQLVAERVPGTLSAETVEIPVEPLAPGLCGRGGADDDPGPDEERERSGDQSPDHASEPAPRRRSDPDRTQHVAPPPDWPGVPMPATLRPWVVQIREILIVEDACGLWDRLFDDLLDDGKHWSVAWPIATRRARLGVFLVARWEQRAAAEDLGVSERTAKSDALALRRAVKSEPPGIGGRPAGSGDPSRRAGWTRRW